MIIETLLVGLVLALLYTEATGIAPGGLIVPGYMALFVDEPKHLAAIVVAAALSLLVFKALSRAMILFGRRRFALLVLTGAVLMQAAFLLVPGAMRDAAGLRVVGFVIPGILAGSVERQKPGPTVASLAIVTAATFAVMKVVAWL